MRIESKKWLREGKSVGFVPTMGALHRGHLCLVEASKRGNDVTVVSIFVNPAQFGPREDFQRYPRDLEKDLKILAPLSPEVVFAPEASDMYPAGFQTSVSVDALSKPLCGESRPGHFRGVATIVLKLFNLISPERAYFGEKDFQQLQVIRQMADDLNLDVEIIGCPTVREPDGLAVSSRNIYLSRQERKDARAIYSALREARDAVASGERDAAKLRRLIEDRIGRWPAARIDYVAVADPETLAPLDRVERETLLAVAVRVGTTRLIDNVRVDVDKP